MADLKQFRKDNGLTQSDIASFLGGGVEKGFISQIEHGSRRLPDAQLAKLLHNEMGWNISALMENTPTISAKASGSGNNKATVSIGGDADSLAMLRKENEMLREMLADRDRQIEFLKELLKR